MCEVRLAILGIREDAAKCVGYAWNPRLSMPRS